MIEITPEIIASFRTANPRFANCTAWPNDVVSIALCEGDAETGGKNWGTYQDDCHNFKRRGMFLYAAHWLTVNYPSANGAADQGANAPGAIWTTQSKSVGDESVSFVNGSLGSSSVASGDAWLSTTQYGQQWLRLRRRAGMGALAV